MSVCLGTTGEGQEQRVTKGREGSLGVEDMLTVLNLVMYDLEHQIGIPEICAVCGLSIIPLKAVRKTVTCDSSLHTSPSYLNPLTPVPTACR